MFYLKLNKNCNGYSFEVVCCGSETQLTLTSPWVSQYVTGDKSEETTTNEWNYNFAL